jgi:tetratricopeptide (TPR) repeat protein
MKAIVVAALLVPLAPAVAEPQAAGAAQGAAKKGAAPGSRGAAKPAAEDAATALARAHFRRGAQLYREARYADAIAEFQAAYRLKPSGVLHYNVGQAQEKLGQTSAALASYEAYLREEPGAPNRDTVQRAIANLRARLGSGAAATGAGAAGAPVAPPIPTTAAPAAGAPPPPPAGAAALSGGAPAAAAAPAPASGAVAPAAAGPPGPAALAPSPSVLGAEATKPVPAPRPVERKSWVAPIVLGGLAAVAAGTGAILGAQAKNAQDQLLAGAADRAQADALARKAQSSATAANVLYGVAGAAALAGGAVLVFGGYF